MPFCLFERRHHWRLKSRDLETIIGGQFVTWRRVNKVPLYQYKQFLVLNQRAQTCLTWWKVRWKNEEQTKRILREVDCINFTFARVRCMSCDATFELLKTCCDDNELKWVVKFCDLLFSSSHVRVEGGNWTQFKVRFLVERRGRCCRVFLTVFYGKQKTQLGQHLHLELERP